MKLIIKNSHFRIMLERGEPLQVLYDLRTHLTYCDPEYKYKLLLQAQGKPAIIDYEDLDQLQDFAFFAEQWPSFQNYLCQRINKLKGETNLNYNFIMGYGFESGEAKRHNISIVYVRQFQRDTADIRAGWLRRVIFFFQEYYSNIQISFEDYRKNLVVQDMTQFPVYELEDEGNPVILWQDQKRIVDKLRITIQDQDNYGYLFHTVSLDLAPNVGKTYISASLVKQFENAPVVAFYNSQQLANKAVWEYSKLGFDVGVIMANTTGLNKFLRSKGMKPNYKKGVAPFTVVMVQTLEARLKKGTIQRSDLSYFKIGLLDETDKIATDRCLKVYDQFTLGLYLCMSGTLYASFSGSKRFTVMGLGGSQRYKITHKDWVEEGKSLRIIYRQIHIDITVQALQGVTIGEFGKVNLSGKKDVKRHLVYTSKNRLDQLVKILHLHHNAQVLIYCGGMEIEDLHFLHNYLKNDNQFNVRVTWGEDPNRVENFQDFYEGKFPILIANQILGVGVNLPKTEVIANWGTSGSYEQFLQGPIGRLSRMGGMLLGYLYDWHIDDGKGSLWQDSLLRRFYAKREGIELEIDDNFEL